MKNRIVLLLCFVMVSGSLQAMSSSPRGSRSRANQAGEILNDLFKCKMGLKKLAESLDDNSKSMVNEFIGRQPSPSLPDVILVTKALNSLKNSGDTFDLEQVRLITGSKGKENLNPLANSI